jgi:FkbM family methyltransferase
LMRAGSLLSRVGSMLDQSPSSLQRKRVAPWFRDQGDKTLRVEYDLNENSLVFDLGGYEGNWSSDIFARYCCSIHVFEPVEDFATSIQTRFSRNKRIAVHRFGLSNKTIKTQIYLNKDATSTFMVTSEPKEISLINVSDFLAESGVTKIDLMKINIEGGEYDLLECLVDRGLITSIRNVQVQFHEFVTDAENRMTTIQTKLAQTHYLTYQYPFVWENWKIKEI